MRDRPEAPPQPPATETQARSGRDSWSELMRLTFGLDVLQCLRCGGRLKYVATILDRRVAQRILEHLGRPARAPPVAPARDPAPFWDAVEAHMLLGMADAVIELSTLLLTGQLPRRLDLIDKRARAPGYQVGFQAAIPAPHSIQR